MSAIKKCDTKQAITGSEITAFIDKLSKIQRYTVHLKLKKEFGSNNNKINSNIENKNDCNIITDMDDNKFINALANDIIQTNNDTIVLKMDTNNKHKSNKNAAVDNDIDIFKHITNINQNERIALFTKLMSHPQHQKELFNIIVLKSNETIKTRQQITLSKKKNKKYVKQNDGNDDEKKDVKDDNKHEKKVTETDIVYKELNKMLKDMKDVKNIDKIFDKCKSICILNKNNQDSKMYVKNDCNKWSKMYPIYCKKDIKSQYIIILNSTKHIKSFEYAGKITVNNTDMIMYNINNGKHIKPKFDIKFDIKSHTVGISKDLICYVSESNKVINHLNPILKMITNATSEYDDINGIGMCFLVENDDSNSFLAFIQSNASQNAFYPCKNEATTTEMYCAIFVNFDFIEHISGGIFTFNAKDKGVTLYGYTSAFHEWVPIPTKTMEILIVLEKLSVPTVNFNGNDGFVSTGSDSVYTINWRTTAELPNNINGINATIYSMISSRKVNTSSNTVIAGPQPLLLLSASVNMATQPVPPLNNNEHDYNCYILDDGVLIPEITEHTTAAITADQFALDGAGTYEIGVQSWYTPSTDITGTIINPTNITWSNPMSVESL